MKLVIGKRYRFKQEYREEYEQYGGHIEMPHGFVDEMYPLATKKGVELEKTIRIHNKGTEDENALLDFKEFPDTWCYPLRYLEQVPSVDVVLCQLK